MPGSPGQAAPGGSIRTFLIADVRGYTRFTAQHGDEAASRLAVRFAQVAGEGVEAWGGELVELRGDEALAVFTSARQALRAAVELQSAFADETATDPTLPLGVGIGLDAGEAVPVGDGYRGAALNMAARLCGIAAAGEVLASANLVHLTGQVDGLAFQAPEAASLKSFDAPVQVVRVRADGPAPAGVSAPAGVTVPAGGPSPSAGGAPAATLPLPTELDPIVPLAGREGELRWLGWHWRRASRGHGRTVVLSGAPGIGKTRLAAELATLAREGGALVSYVPAGRQADDGWALGVAGERPALVVVDDLDAASPDVVRAVVERAADLAGRATLLLVTHRLEAPPSLVALAERLASPEQRRTLGPLDEPAIREIAALYAGRAADDAPLGEIVAESGGVPAAVHRVAGRWARTSAAKRLGASADRTAAERRGLRAAEADLIGDMADLELARERERLFAASEEAQDGVAASRTVCPYKGLAEFEAADTEHYFGRERLIAELVAKIVGARFLGLVGDSGSGKSSALRAGLLPALAGGVLPGSDRWPQVLLRPGEHPLAELRRALARAMPDVDLPDDPAAALAGALAALPMGHRLVVFVDQFEEVFNATRDEGERSAFIDLLTSERPGLKVIVSLRADHYGRCAVYPALARLLGSDQVLVGPLSATELAAVIEHPAQQVGLRVEPALTAALVADTGGEPGVLPLLSTTLLELWGAREGERLTLASYRASGGLHGAIARLAEATFAELDPHRRQVARALLLRLAGPGEGTELVRRRVALEELDAERDPVTAELLERLSSARLLTIGDGHVEVAHEALLREWPRLQEWLEEDAAGRQVRLHLIGAVRDWEERGREPGDLYRGARLATALEWAGEHAVELNASEREFLQASQRSAELEVERQRRTNRRLRILLAGAAAALLVAVGAGGLAVLQGQRAEEEAARAAQQAELAASEAARATEEQRRAESEATRAEEQRAAADRNATTARARELLASAIAARQLDPSLAKLLAVQAMSVEKAPTFQSTSVLHDVLAADPVIAHFSWPEDRNVTETWMDLAPEGDAFAAVVYAEDRSNAEEAVPLPDVLEAISLPDGALRWSFPAPAAGDQVARLWDPFYTKDGTRVISAAFWEDPKEGPEPYAGRDLGVLVIDAATGELMRTIDVGPCGAHLHGVDGEVALIRTPRPASDGACDWGDSTGLPLQAVDLVTGSVRTLDAEAPDWGTAIGAGGRIVAYDTRRGDEQYVRVVDSQTGELILEIDLKSIPISMVHGARAVSPDGRYLVYGGRPGLIVDLQASSSDRLVYTKIQALWGEDSGFIFDRTGASILGTARDGTMRRWAVPSGLQIEEWPAVQFQRPSLSADGHLALIGGGDAGPAATLYRIDRRSHGDLAAAPTCDGFTVGSSLQIADGTGALFQVCDGMQPLSGMLQVFDADTLKLRQSLPELGTQRLALSPDGRLAAAQRVYDQNRFGPPVVVDLSTGSVVRELTGTCDWSGAQERPPDGCERFPETPFPVWAETIRWSPDGRMIAVLDGWAIDGGPDRNVVVWDASTGELIFRAPGPDEGVDREGNPAVWWDTTFTPDSSSLLISDTAGRTVRYATKDWSRTQAVTPEDDAAVAIPRFLGFDALGRLIVSDASNFQRRSSLAWLDPGTLQVLAFVEVAHLGSLKGFAITPDGTTLATGASDGIIRVWDTATQQLLQEARVPAQVQGLAFVDNERLVVAPDGGGLATFTTDPGELLRLVRSSLSRGFTETECATYGIDPCPTLEEMR